LVGVVFDIEFAGSVGYGQGFEEGFGFGTELPDEFRDYADLTRF
jgi:hypothetical protein